MRIACPHCGERDVAEFVCRGEAPAPRPTDDAAMFDHVYLRDNVRGVTAEHWYHAQGCRQWLIVRRDTATHAILSVEFPR